MRPDDGLARVERELRVHPERRLAFLEEIGADLDDLTADLRRTGMSPLAARAEATRRLMPDAAAISELEAAHDPAIGRSAPIVWLRRWERAAVLLLAGGMAAWLAWVAVLGGVSARNPLVWFELALAALMTAGWAEAGLGLWLGDDLRPEDRRRHGRRHGGLIVAAFAAGALGTAVEVYALIDLALPGPDSSRFWGAVGRAASTATLAIGVPILGLLMWLSLTPRLVRYERVEARIRRLFAAPRLRIEEGDER